MQNWKNSSPFYDQWWGLKLTLWLTAFFLKIFMSWTFSKKLLWPVRTFTVWTSFFISSTSRFIFARRFWNQVITWGRKGNRYKATQNNKVRRQFTLILQSRKCLEISFRFCSPVLKPEKPSRSWKHIRKKWIKSNYHVMTFRKGKTKKMKIRDENIFLIKTNFECFRF